MKGKFNNNTKISPATQQGQKLKIIFHGLLVAALIITIGISEVFAQVSKEKKIDMEFKDKRILEVDHLHGDLEVRTSNDNKVRANIVFAVEAKSEEDVQTVFDNLKMNFQESGDKLTITTNFGTKNWNTNNGVTSIEFKNGTKVNGIKNIELFFTLYVPKLDKLILSNKYDDIHIEDDISAQLTVKLNSGVFQAENIKGGVKLEGKYSKMKMKNVSGDADIDLYDTDVEMGNAQKVNVVSKYSDLTLGDITGITHDSYDDNVTIGANSGQLKLTSKYSEFTVGGATSAIINSYDDVMNLGNIKGTLGIETKYTNFKIGTFTSASIASNDDEFTLEGGEKSTLKVNSKYSEFKINKLSQIEFESSYDDQMNINQLGSFKAVSKYGEFTINKLENSLNISSEDDNVNVRQLSANFTDISLTGKYTTFELSIPSGLKYQLEADLTYGKIEYPENDFEYRVHVEKGSAKEIKGKIKGASDTSPKIVIDQAYDCQVYLK